MVKKRFGISPTINKALTQTIQMAEAEGTNFINTEILMNRIFLDPENPRRHKITLEDLDCGLKNADINYMEKQIEYQNISELSESIKKDGLLHPIVVYKKDDDYQLVAGERRYMACFLAGKKVIDARVFKHKPKSFDLKVIQWAENESRKNLTLYNKLKNVESIIDAFTVEYNKKITAIKLAGILNCSRQSAQYYIAILANPALIELIGKGEVKTWAEAKKLSSVKNREVLNDESHNVKMSPKPKILETDELPKKPGKIGRKRTSVALGSTKKPEVAKFIVKSVLSSVQFIQFESDFESTDWLSLDESTKAIKKLIKLLEKEGALTG
jgi:ParB/RepB/Spo0J family partition protein